MPSFATYIGSIPRSSAAPATGGLHRHRRLAHEHRDARGARQLVEHRGHAAARRVAHAAQRRARPPRAARRRRATAAACRTRSSASSSNSPRASMIAVPCSPIGPETRIRSPGRSAAGESSARGSTGRGRSCRRTSSRRGRARRPWCRRPRLDAGRLGGARDRLDLGAQLVGRQALLEDSERLSASGRAPATARSLTVPLTASSPIEPPGKRIGLTTKLSVVSASRAPSTVTRRRRRARPSARAEGRHEQALDQRLRRLAAGAVGHRDALVAELRPLARARSR